MTNEQLQLIRQFLESNNYTEADLRTDLNGGIYVLEAKKVKGKVIEERIYITK